MKPIAADDPFVPLDTLREARAQAGPKVQFLWTPHGGHVGFVAELRRLRSSWAVTESLSFLPAQAADEEQKRSVHR